METTEICETIINKLNGQYLQGSGVAHDPILVKFADGGPKKNKQDKVWRNPSDGYLGYEIRNAVSTNGSQPTARVTPVVQNPMMTQGHGSNANMAYHIPASGVNWGVQPQSYAVVSPHGVPLTPSPVETMPGMQQSIPQMTNQLAQMHMHGSGNQYILPTHGGYTQQNSWQLAQTHPQESSVIMTATEVESSYPPQHLAHHQSLQHVTEPLYSDDQQTRVVYAPYARK